MWYRTQGKEVSPCWGLAISSWYDSQCRPCKVSSPLIYLCKSASASWASLGFMLLLVLQTSYGIIYLKGEKNQWVSTNKLLPAFRKGKKKTIPIKNKQNPTNKQWNLPSGKTGKSVCLCKPGRGQVHWKPRSATSRWRRLWLSTFYISWGSTCLRQAGNQAYFNRQLHKKA